MFLPASNQICTNFFRRWKKLIFPIDANNMLWRGYAGGEDPLNHSRPKRLSWTVVLQLDFQSTSGAGIQIFTDSKFTQAYQFLSGWNELSRESFRLTENLDDTSTKAFSACVSGLSRESAKGETHERDTPAPAKKK